MDFPAINGYGHIDFSVTDVDRSVQWWEQVVGFELVHQSEHPDFTLANVYHPSGVFVGLMTHTNPASERFDERAIGLDHFALRVPDRPALEAWAKHLDRHGVEHSGVQEQNLGPLIVFRDPDNIQLELLGLRLPSSYHPIMNSYEAGILTFLVCCVVALLFFGGFATAVCRGTRTERRRRA